MHPTWTHRRALAARILAALGLASLTPPDGGCTSSAAGTGGGTAASSSTGAGGAASSSSSGTACASASDCPCGQCLCVGTPVPGTARDCKDGACVPLARACASFCAVIDAGVADAMEGTCTGTGGDSTGPPAVEECFDRPDAGACPTNYGDALDDFLALNCPSGWEPYEILSGPTDNATDQCCYMVHLILCTSGGRPYVVDERRRVARSEPRGRGEGWAGGRAPSAEALTSAQRARLAEAWTADGLAEHASVASFSRFALELLALGAPAELVQRAHEAALDEIEHARLCFALASAYAGAEVGPGRFPVGERVEVPATLESVAVRTFWEGCVGETVAAAVAAEQLVRAEDPAVRAALERIAADEAGHAELAWRTVAWAVRTGGDGVKAVLRRAVEAVSAATREPNGSGAGGDTSLERFGRLDAPTIARIAASTSVEVILPCATALLG